MSFRIFFVFFFGGTGIRFWTGFAEPKTGFKKKPVLTSLDPTKVHHRVLAASLPDSDNNGADHLVDPV